MKKAPRKQKLREKTRLEDFIPFLVSLTEKYPNKPPVIIGGHAVNYWINHYKDRLTDTPRTPLGKDLDLLIDSEIVAKEFMGNSEIYQPPAVFFFDLSFMALRRHLIKKKITPLMLWFICRAGKITTPAADGKAQVEVDFFAHSLGHHPKHVIKHSETVLIDESAVHVMNPVQCLWNFIANAATLHQTMGDSGPRKRLDHLRCQLLVPIVRLYLEDLSQNNDKANRSSLPNKQPLKSSLKDLLHFMRRSEYPIIAETIGLRAEKLLSDSVSKQQPEICRKITEKGNRKAKNSYLLPKGYPKPTPGTLITK